MNLEPGHILSHYRLLEKIGEGGMGVVWKALDTVLGRHVAIKIVPEPFATDADRLARFQREARLLASLNHANIAAIHGLHEAGGVHFLAMELVTGETIADRIARGAFPVDEVLTLGLQICEALEAAHASGIIHRDLKPSNIQITPEGQVKVLDFGLAKALLPADEDSAADATQSPTLTLGSSRVGQLLGTAAYMSPEQARGRAADRRSDIWAFGVVLFEMLTGRLLFRGETVSDTLAAVLRADFDWDELPAATPRPLRRLLRRCLERDPHDRLHDTADARLELEEARLAPEEEAAAPAPPPRRGILPWTTAAVLALVVLALTGSLLTRVPPPEATITFELRPPADRFFSDDETPPTLSPDGTVIAFGGWSPLDRDWLGIRRLDRVDFEILNVTAPWDAFWSPDGRHLGYVDWAAKRLMRIDVRGGPSLALADAPDSRGGTWNEDGVIVFAPDEEGPLYRLNASGGDPVPVTTLDAERRETGHVRPQFLPDGKRFLYHAIHEREAGETARGESEQGASLWVGALDGAPPRRIDGWFTSAASYAPPGYLLYAREGTLLARPLDLRTLTFRSDPVILAQRLSERDLGYAAFSVSRNGVLAYYTEPIRDVVRRLTWRDRQGSTQAEFLVPGRASNLDLSPDGRRAAMERRDEARNMDIWITDVDRGTDQRLTFGPTREYGPVWSPDGRRVAFARATPPINHILIRDATGAGEEAVVWESETWMEVIDWSPDGKLLLFEEWVGGSRDLWVLPATGGERVPFATTPFDENTGRFSPDGRWIAYQSNETGRPEVYVRSWDGPPGKWTISAAGGRAARWNGDGSEIFYVDPDERLIAAAVAPDEEEPFRSLTPEVLFLVGSGDYEPSPDGKRFLVMTSDEGGAPLTATVVLNWPALLEERD